MFSFFNGFFNFKKKTFYKKKQLVLSGIAIFLNFIIWKQAEACDFGDTSFNFLMENYKKKRENKLEMVRPKDKNFDFWTFSFKNLSKYLIPKKRFKKNVQNKFGNDFWQKNKNYLRIGGVLEKINEIEKFDLKNNKWNLGQILLSNINLIKIQNSFLLTNKDNVRPKELPICLESIENNLRNYPEIQLSSGIINLYPEIKEFFSLKNLFPLDISKGFVQNTFAKKSGLKISNYLKSTQKNFGYYTQKNLQESYKNSVENTSNILKKNINQKKKNKKFKKYKYKQVLNYRVISRIFKIIQLKKRSKKKTNDKSYIAFKYIRNKKEKNIEQNIHTQLINPKLKPNYEFYSVSSLKNMISLKNNPYLFNSSLLRKRKERLKKLKFGQNRYKTTFSNPESNAFKYFPYINLKADIPCSTSENFFTHRESFIFHNLCKTKKSLISKQFGNKFLNVFRQNIGLRSFILPKKVVKFNFRDLSLIFSKNIFSKKNYCYTKEKEDEIFFCTSKRYNHLNDFESLNFLGKNFSRGKYIPKSFYHSYISYAQSSILGNSEAQFNLSGLYFYGKGVSRDKKQSFYLNNSSFKRGNVRSLYNSAIILKKGINICNDEIRSLKYVNKLNNLNFKRKKKTKKAKKKQKNSRSNIYFIVLKKPSEFCLSRLYIHSIITPSHFFLSGSIYEKGFLSSYALKNFKNAACHGSFLSSLKLAELLLENRQFFLSFQTIKKNLNFDSSWKNFYMIFKSLTGGGISINYIPFFLTKFLDSGKIYDFFGKNMFFVARTISIFEKCSFCLKFLLSYEFKKLLFF